MKDKELEEQIRDISFGAISEMLDNPDSLGIYPTTKAFKRIDREVLDLIAQERRKAKIEVLEKLKDTIKMHTVPEGRGLITRSYLNNSIDFMLAELKEDNKKGNNNE